MKKGWIATIAIVVLIIAIVVGNITKKSKQENGKYKILTSFYPIYIMTLNITDGAENVEINNMADKTVGCIHDYMLITSDLKKFEDADIFIQNGIGLEKFIDKIINSYPDINIIESAKNVPNLIKEEDATNGHVWLSIDNYISQVKEITESLSKLNERNREKYEKNSNEYIQKLEKIKSEFDELKHKQNQNLAQKEELKVIHTSTYEKARKKAICLNEALEYLLEKLEIEITMIETDHEQSALSAKNIKKIIDEMKLEDIKAIFIDKNDDTKTAEILANETGAKIYSLDSGMNGKEEKDAYINAMKYNYEIIKNMLNYDN